MAQKELDVNTRLTMLELGQEQNHERIEDHDKKWQVAKPVLNKASNQNITVGIAVVITILNLLLLLLR